MITERLDMLLWCPNCGEDHVDAPSNSCENCGHDQYNHKDNSCFDCGCKNLVVWTNPPHKSHRCSDCNTVWRPADFCTNGVESIATRGKNDTWPTIRRTTMLSETLKNCADCGKNYISESHTCGCPGPCGICDGYSHHWMERQDENNDELFYWKCKHCDYKVEYGEPSTHPEGCDCPDHDDELQTGAVFTDCPDCTHTIFENEEHFCPTPQTMAAAAGSPFSRRGAI